MFKYTRAAVSRIVIDLKLLAHIANIVMQSFMIAYLAFSMIIGRGSMLVNGILVGLTAANLVFYLVMYGRATRGAKRLRRRVSRIYVAAKLSVNIVPLASIAYSVYVGASDVTSLALIFTPLMIILWIMQVAFNLVRVYAESRAALLMDGMDMDMQFIKNPVRGIKNRIHDFFGEEHETESEVSEKNRDILEREAAKGKEARRERRARRRAILGEKLRSIFSSDRAEIEDITDTEPEDETADNT